MGKEEQIAFNKMAMFANAVKQANQNADTQKAEIKKKPYPFNDIDTWKERFKSGDEKTVKEFFEFSLPIRFHLYWLLEMGTEEHFNVSMKKCGYNYFNILQMIKDRMPAEFFMYFNDLLMDDEFSKFESAFTRTLKGFF